MCISKNQKLQREAQYGQDKNAFKAMHSDSRAKFVTFCLMSNFCKIVNNTLQFPFQMDYEKPKKASMMQTGPKMTAQKQL